MIQRLRHIASAGGVAMLGGAGVLAFAFTRPPAQHAAPPKDPVALPDAQRCATCHAEEVTGYLRSKMAHSMREGGKEPAGAVQVPGTTISMFSDPGGSWQRLTSQGVSTRYHVDYVIGSGTHASGYLTDIDGHLFQSPVAYYSDRGYGLAPGFEARTDPDFTRPVTAGCVFCHAGSFSAIAGTQNNYGKPPFPHLAIGCERCHGPVGEHLKSPTGANIVDPEDLQGAARDSICEQCHLIGAARVLNPGKQFTDFRPGQPLEDTFTIYHFEAPAGSEGKLRVISHSEQLALSACARNSNGRMWCGTCHDPHAEPVKPVAFYRAKCLSCHAHTVFAADHPAPTSNCIGCHMPERDTTDGGHTVFTDHRIQRQPSPGTVIAEGELVPWRTPGSALSERNLGIASIQVGVEQSAPKKIVDGYRMLTGVQQQFPEDSDMFSSMGTALLLGRQYREAALAFELAVRFDAGSSTKEANLAQAYAALGLDQPARQHGELALAIDPLNVDAAMLLMTIYNRLGDTKDRDELSLRFAGRVAQSVRP